MFLRENGGDKGFSLYSLVCWKRLEYALGRVWREMRWGVMAKRLV